ncbi:uncharacterized protein F5147DRAFT_836894 [Suillus discolor]|uniref:Ubiquitin-like domain-containing protein n=1 Tax=Suillus discolor TaxID=1912936 RepID=A0A9P7F8S5_9AGAM|nr:uncharacterized protein F5147DRAFT_836894 [Suillus discolor]KAG2108619.1 hypothetical protein F5147DRAFT_836894 [Suillus discolor]
MHPGSLAVNPSLEFSIDISSAIATHGNSFARTASDMAQTFLPVVQAVAGAIPVAGPAMQAAISGLLSILQIVDRRTQNQADLDRLRTRLRRLSLYLYNAPSTQDPFEQDRRDAIMKMLLDIHAKVTQLCNRGLVYTSVTQDIVGCSSEIEDYLADYSWSSQMQNQHDINEVRKTLEKQHEILMGIGSMVFTGQSSVGPIVTLGFVTLVDATDRSHTIPMDVCDSFERFNEQLQLLFKHNSNQAQIQRRYMEQGQYDFCIDNDKQVIQLTSHEWPRIEAGMTIVMRVILEQETRPEVEYQCHFCGAVNRVGAEPSLRPHAGCSINCRVCKRRFQISRGNSSKQKTQSCIGYIPGTEAEMHLIRNFHVQQTRNNPNPNLYADGALAVSRSQLKVRGLVFYVA